MAKNEYKPVGMLQVDENAVSNAVNQMVGNNNTIIKNLQDSLQKQQDYDLQKDIAEYNKYADERNFNENQRRFDENLVEKKLRGDQAYELGVRAQTENERNGATNRRIADSQNAISWKQMDLAQKAVDDAAKLKADTRVAYTTLLKLSAAEDALRNHAKQNQQTFDQNFLLNNDYFTDSSLKAARDLYIGRQKVLAGLDPAALANVWALGSSNPQDQRFAPGILGRLIGNTVAAATTSLPLGGANAAANAQPAAAANQNPVSNTVTALQQAQLKSYIKTLLDLEKDYYNEDYNTGNAVGNQLSQIMPFAYQAFNANKPNGVTWGFNSTESNPLGNAWVNWFLQYLQDNGLTTQDRFKGWINNKGKNALSWYAKNQNK